MVTDFFTSSFEEEPVEMSYTAKKRSASMNETCGLTVHLFAALLGVKYYGKKVACGATRNSSFECYCNNR